MSQHPSTQPLFVAQHTALDFVNSRYGTGAAERELLTDDASVLAWLKAAGLLAVAVPAAPRGLAKRALELRAAADRPIRTPDERLQDDLALVNDIRERGRPVQVLAWNEGAPAAELHERRRDDGVNALLEPVATALAQLLLDGAHARVRECEAHDCSLLFEDTTRSGRRRWCSMTLCGNRMKVAAFRSRTQGARKNGAS